MFDMKLTFSSPEFEAAWSDFLAVIVSNKLPYQPIILESYRLSPTKKKKEE